MAEGSSCSCRSWTWNITTALVIVAVYELICSVLVMLVSGIGSKGGETKLMFTIGVIVCISGGGLTKIKMLFWPLAITADKEGQHSGRRVATRETMLRHRSGLHERESLKLQQFEHDCADMKSWMDEQMNTTPIDNDNEMQTNRARVDVITHTGRELLWRYWLNTGSGHYAADQIGKRLQEIHQCWAELVKSTELKASQLRDSRAQAEFNRTIEGVESWLHEIEGTLNSEDVGQDLISGQTLLKKHSLLEGKIAAYTERMDVVSAQASEFETNNHFDVPNIRLRERQLWERYQALQTLNVRRRARLEESLRRHQSSDMEEALRWIDENDQAVSSDFGGDLTTVTTIQAQRFHHISNDTIIWISN